MENCSAHNNPGAYRKWVIFCPFCLARRASCNPREIPYHVAPRADRSTRRGCGRPSVRLEQMGSGHLKMLAHDGLDTLDLFAVLFDQVADIDHALEAGAEVLRGGWVFGVR